MSTRKPRSCRRAIPSFRSPYAGPDSLPGGGTTPGDLDHDRLPRRSALAGRRDLFRSRAGAGLWPQRHARHCRLLRTARRKRPARRIPKFRPQRYYLKQTFGLGGEQEDVADAANQLAGKRDIDRVTLIVGRFAVGDFFDNNSYAHDPRADFMNWAMWSSAAYDFPADLPGYTRGAVVELNRKDWAVRAGAVRGALAAQQRRARPSTAAAPWSNSKSATRSSISPASCGIGVFATSGNTGNYRQALAIEAADPALDINAVMASIRHANPKYGFYVNLEQQIVKDVGLFARASWNDGQNEILSFTDIDRSALRRAVDQGQLLGTPERHHRHRRRDQRTFRRASRLPRRRRHRPVDRRRPAQLQPRADLRDLLCLSGQQAASRSPPTISSSQIPPITPTVDRSRSSRAACTANSSRQ